MRQVANSFRVDVISEVGAVCGSAARTDLCGGRSAMAVPTATRIPILQYTTAVASNYPFGSGRKMGNSWNRATDALLGGWRMAIIVNWCFGLPINVGLNWRSDTLLKTTDQPLTWPHGLPH